MRRRRVTDEVGRPFHIGVGRGGDVELQCPYCLTVRRTTLEAETIVCPKCGKEYFRDGAVLDGYNQGFGVGPEFETEEVSEFPIDSYSSALAKTKSKHEKRESPPLFVWGKDLTLNEFLVQMDPKQLKLCAQSLGIRNLPKSKDALIARIIAFRAEENSE